MKPIYNKTGLENLLELIKKDNPSAIINAEQLMEVTIDVNRDNGNATAVLVAEVDQGYSGSVAVEWVRQQFVNYITDGNYIQLLEGETETEVKERIAQTFNLVLSDLTYQGFSLPELTQNQAVVFTMTGNEGFVYPETSSVSVLISTVAITEETRGNVDMIRITDNGLVRGIVVKDPGTGGETGEWFFVMDEMYNDPYYDKYGLLYPDLTDPSVATTTYTPPGGGGDTLIPYSPVFFEGSGVAETYTQSDDPGYDENGTIMSHLLLRPAIEQIHIGLDVQYGPITPYSGSLQDWPMSEWYFYDVRFTLWPTQNDTISFRATWTDPNTLDETLFFNHELPITQETISIRILSLNTQTGEGVIEYTAPGGHSGSFNLPTLSTVIYSRLDQPPYGVNTVDCTGDYATFIKVMKSNFWDTQPVSFSIVDITSASPGVPYKDAQSYTYTPETHTYMYGASVTFTPKPTPEVIYLEFEVDVAGYTPDYNNSGIAGRFFLNWLQGTPADVDSFTMILMNGVFSPGYGAESQVYTLALDGGAFTPPSGRVARSVERLGVLIDQPANTFTIIFINDAVTDENRLDDRSLVTHTFPLLGEMMIGCGFDLYGNPELSTNLAYPDIKGILLHNGPVNSFLKTLVDPTLLAKIESAVPLSTVTQTCTPLAPSEPNQPQT